MHAILFVLFMRALFQLCFAYVFCYFKLLMYLCAGLIHAEDPWSIVQTTFLSYQLFVLVTGVALVARHWNGGPDYDPSPGLFGSVHLESFYMAFSFRKRAMRKIYATVFQAVYVSSALCLARDIVVYTSTKAITVLGVLAHCVFPMHAADGSVLTVAARRVELLYRGGIACIVGGTCLLISSLTKVRAVAMVDTLDSLNL